MEKENIKPENNATGSPMAERGVYGKIMLFRNVV
jgi:hypothetical protein